MRARWGPQRIVRLDALPPDQARAIRAYLEVAKYEKAAPASDDAGTAQEAHGASREPSAA